MATCALNQWALDFEGNLERIFRSEWGGRTSLPPSARFLSGRQRRPCLLYTVRLSEPQSRGGGRCGAAGGGAGPRRRGRLGGPGLSVRLVFNPTLFQVLTSRRAREPGTGLVQNSKSGKSAASVRGLTRSQLITEERSVRKSAM